MEKQEHVLRIEERKEEEERRANMKGEEGDAGQMAEEVERKKQEGMMGWVNSGLGAIGLGSGGGGSGSGGQQKVHEA